MKLPGGDRAIVLREKLVGYCLDSAHHRGGHKAVVFGSALGITRSNWQILQSALQNAAVRSEAEHRGRSSYGERYRIDFKMTTDVGTATVRSNWIVENEHVTRLTSCWIPSRKGA